MASSDARPEPPLVVIVGPTASGKTSLAIDMAMKYGGEIICADSRTVYKGMDVGTAKPTLAERAKVRHWGLDIVEPGDRYTAAEFKDYATKTIADIRSRGKIPFLVGGTGLYVDGVLFDYQFGESYDDIRRTMLAKLTVHELINYSIENNIELPENISNKRYIIRAIEQNGINNKRYDKPLSNSIIVGIATDRLVLRSRIASRIEQLFEDGVVEEAIKLGKKYGWKSEAMTGNIYPLIYKYYNGHMTKHEIVEKATVRDWQLAKRQLTWFRRNRYIQWMNLSAAKQYLANRLESRS